MRFEIKLNRYIAKLKKKYPADKIKDNPKLQLEALEGISWWVHDNYIYTNEGLKYDPETKTYSGKLDTWITSFQEAIAKARDGFGRGDCDDLAVMCFLLGRLLGITKLRLAIVYKKIGRKWKNNCHMVVLFNGLGSGKYARMIPSTQFIGKWAISVKKAFERDRVWLSESFNEKFRWVHPKPVKKKGKR